MNSERECYGKMFPSVVEMTINKPTAGKVFGYEMYYSGQVAQMRRTTVNDEAWRECLKCPHLDACHRLSTGRMLMELAVKATPGSLYG